ncbi:MAG: glycosyltransferase family 2 protein [Candidatus Binatia bacterium]
MILTIILPCYNEEKNISHIRKKLFEVLDTLDCDYEVIIVDDGSEDNTLDEINHLMKCKGKIKLYQHVSNRGMGAAIRTAIPHSTGDVTITMDSDLTFHPKLIPELLDRFKEGDVDCVIGSPALHNYDKTIPLYRIFLSRGLNTIYSICLGKNLTAVSPIFRLYKTEQLKELNLQSNKFEINAEIVAKLLMKKKRIVEIPAKLTVRQYGESKLDNFKEIRNHLKLLAKIIYWRIRA